MPFKVLTLFLVSFTLFTAYSESHFSLDPAVDGVTAAASLGVFLPSQFLDSGAENNKERSDINGFDRPLMYGYSESLDTVGTVFALSALMLPGVTMLEEKGRENWLTYGVMYTEAFLLTAGTKDFLKGMISRNRPFSYMDDSIPEGEEDDYYNSFPSGHTAYAFLGSTFLTTVLLEDYADSPWTKPLIAGGYTLAAGVGALRVASGCHFVSDVLAGAAIGSFFGWLVPTLHVSDNRAIAIAPLYNGLTFTYYY